VGATAEVGDDLGPAVPAPRQGLALDLDDDDRAVGHGDRAFREAQALGDDLEARGPAAGGHRSPRSMPSANSSWISPASATTVAAVIAALVVDRAQAMPPVTQITAGRIASIRILGDDSRITWNSISASIAQATSAISGIRRSPPCRTRITEAISAQTTRAVPKSMVIAAMIPPLRPRLALDRRRCCVESADLLRRRRAFGLVERAVDRVAERRVI